MKIAVWQLAVAVIGMLIWWQITDLRAGVAGFAGGLIGAISTTYYALRAFLPGRSGGQQDAGEMLGRLFRATVLRWAVIVASLVVVMMVFRDRLAPVATVFAASLLMFLPALGWTSAVPDESNE